MSVENNVPEIRFNGFSGEWAVSNLAECTDLLTGNPFNSKKFTDGGIFLVRGMNVKRGYLDTSPSISEYWPSSKGLERYLLEPNDIVIQMDGALIGKSYAKINSQNLPAILVQRVTRVRCSEVNPEIIYQYIQKDFLGHISGIKTETAVPHLSLHDIRNFSVSLPDGEEQTAIGNTFQKLDSLINQHQQKHDKLSNIKKAMLEKMFPKQGETIPEIRFKGFSGEWEVRSWRDTVDISTNMVDPRSSQYGELFHVGPGNIESFTGMFYNNVLKVKDSNLISGKFHFNKGDIIYGKINPQLAKYVIAPFEGLASADAYVLSAKNGVVQNYLYAILQTEDFYKYTVSVSSRTGMPKINRDELNIYSYLSPDEAEQERIGSYFQKLDALIKQHQQQITKLNNIKQACLSKMFV